MDTGRAHARDAALRRLRRLTGALVAGAGALALASGLVAAKAFPGRSPHSATRHVVRPAAVPPARPTQAAPPLTAVGSGTAQPQSPSASAPPAPAPTDAPPVVVSGGS